MYLITNYLSIDYIDVSTLHFAAYHMNNLNDWPII